MINPSLDSGQDGLVCWSSIEITVSGQVDSQMLDGVGRLNEGDASRLVSPRKWVQWGQVHGSRLGNIDNSPRSCTKCVDGALYCGGDVLEA